MTTFTMMAVRCFTCGKPVGNWQETWDFRTYIENLFKLVQNALASGQGVNAQIQELVTRMRLNSIAIGNFSIERLQQAANNNDIAQILHLIEPHLESVSDYFDKRRIKRTCCRKTMAMPTIHHTQPNREEINAGADNTLVYTWSDWQCRRCEAVTGAKEYRVRRLLREGLTLEQAFLREEITSQCCRQELTQILSGKFDPNPISNAMAGLNLNQQPNVASISTTMSGLNQQPNVATMGFPMLDDSANEIAPAHTSQESLSGINFSGAPALSDVERQAMSDDAPGINIPSIGDLSAMAMPTMAGFGTSQMNAASSQTMLGLASNTNQPSTYGNNLNASNQVMRKHLHLRN